MRKSDNRADEQEQQGELRIHRSVSLPSHHSGGINCDTTTSTRQIDEWLMAFQRL
jgi:hypothetical protein